MTGRVPLHLSYQWWAARLAVQTRATITLTPQGSHLLLHMHTERANWWVKYSLLVHIFTARDRRALEPHVWVEDLLKDFL